MRAHLFVAQRVALDTKAGRKLVVAGHLRVFDVVGCVAQIIDDEAHFEVENPQDQTSEHRHQLSASRIRDRFEDRSTRYGVVKQKKKPGIHTQKMTIPGLVRQLQ